MAGIPLILLAAVFFPGIIIRTKSIVSGRKGPGILQPMLDIRVLFGKGSVYSTTTGWVFKLAPVIGLATMLTALTVVPFANMPALIPFQADFVFFSYMLALGKFFTIIGALDTGSSFEGMGANREALYSMLVEPAFLVLMGTFAMLTGYTSFSDMFMAFHVSGNPIITVFGLIGFYLLVQIALIELKTVNMASLIFVSAETLIFKAIIVPYFLFRIINQTKVYKVHSKAFPSFYSLLFTMAGLFVSIILSNILKNPSLDAVFLTIALFTLFTGVLLIITHRRIFSHMVGFLVVENAVFFFSLAVGSEMPMLINIGILLDIFVSVLIIGVLMNRIGTQFSDLESDNLTSLKH
ncbi:MAG: NADH-quinone oxidoreductase subunit H [Bacteroidales bacterium]